ncbi:MAG: hypothetical protein KF724_04650 [Phycisphaeraceae bacterium]|nr:hypothetical protein [Phycisphaeraceae bacterium]
MTASEPRISFIAAKPGWVVALAVVGGVALLLLSLLWQEKPGRAERRSRISDVVDVVTPTPITEEEIRSGAGQVRQERVALEAGAWIQVADDQGRLQQRYRAQRIDPEPDRWMRMEQPLAVMFPREGRVVTMRADHGRARVPRTAIQAGRLTGGVEIRLYRSRDGSPIRFVDGNADLPIGEPAMIIRTDEAQFDEVLGEIRCDGWVEVEADEEQVEAGVLRRNTVHFKGEGLSLVFDPTARTVERLSVERPVTPIRITRLEQKAPGTSEGAHAPEATATTPAIAAPSASTPSGPAEVPAVVSAAPAAGAPATAPTDAPASSLSALESERAIAAVPGPSSASETPDESRPYRLTLQDRVVIHRVVNGRETFVRGDRLTALFSLQSSGLRDAFASSAPLGALGGIEWCIDHEEPSENDEVIPGWMGVPWPGRLVLLTLAAEAEPVMSRETITIGYEGRLVMIPADESRELLTNSEDVLLVIESLERGGMGFVEIEDLSARATVRCDRLVYQGATEIVDLEGSTRQPLQVRSPQLEMTAGRMLFDRRNGEGQVPGDGRLRLGDRDKPAAPRAPASPPGVLPREVEITWQERLDIELEDESKGSRIRSARFQGDVKVDHADFALGSRSLLAQFGPGRAGRDDAVLKRIVADGNAKASRLGDQGSLAATLIDLELDEDSQGRPIPTVMKARGRVEARDSTQTMWSPDLMVFFEPKGADSAATPRGVRGGLALEGDMGDVEVTRVLAGTLEELGPPLDASAGGDAGPIERGVQVLLRDGARVFAKRLDGNARDRRVTLDGPDVMIVQRNVVADGLQHLDIDEAKGMIVSVGPGRFRQFREPVVDEAVSPRTRPVPAERPMLDASWSEAMRFNDRAHGGGGTLDLDGSVRVRAERSAREYSALDARTVQLDFRRDANAAPSGAEPAPAGEGEAKESDGLLKSGTRSLERFVAKGDARLESQTWATDARQGTPRLFVVTGDHVEYQTLTGRADVIGPGSLLVHDTNARADGGGGVDLRGTTRFKWTSAMRMVPLSPGSQQFIITMGDSVEMKHAGLAQGSDMTLSCRTLEATIVRPGFEPGAAPGSATGAKPADAATGALAKSADIDLGGPAELRRIVGRGQVMITAPDANIECEEFDYDLATQIAQMRARDGRLVTVLQRGSATPVRAASVIWDRATGRMTVQSGGGGVGR